MSNSSSRFLRPCPYGFGVALPRLAAGFTLLTALCAFTASPARAARLLGDGAVFDASRGIAFVAQPQGGIEALDLATGKAIWRSAAAAKPLALLEGVLLAQDEPGTGSALRLATLDPATGAAKARFELTLPEGSKATVTDNLRGTFRVRAAADGDRAVAIAWTATAAQPLRGFLPPEGSRAPMIPAAAAGGFRRGAARLDLATGGVVPVADAEIVGVAAAIDRGIGSRAGAALGSGLDSIDGRHALTSERVAGSLHTYRWSISDRATEKVIAVLDAPVSLAPFVVVGNQVIYLAQPEVRRENGLTLHKPLRLRSLDLSTGAEVWQAVVRDSAYRGPVPP